MFTHCVPSLLYTPMLETGPYATFSLSSISFFLPVCESGDTSSYMTGAEAAGGVLVGLPFKHWTVAQR